MCDALVRNSDILLPPLHIKLGLIKNFIKALDKGGPAFLYLWNFFPASDAKIREGVLNGPDVRKLSREGGYDRILSQKGMVGIQGRVRWFPWKPQG
jgi:hypothetical protein